MAGAAGGGHVFIMVSDEGGSMVCGVLSGRRKVVESGFRARSLLRAIAL